VFINIPWIESRKRKLLAIIFDFLICYLLYNILYFKEFNIYPNKIVTISFTIFWIISSYVIGRYIGSVKLTLLNILKSIIKSLFLFILCNIIYLIINWWIPLLIFWDDSNIFSFGELNNFFLKITFFIFIFSTIIQYLFGLITYKIYNKKIDWCFLGTEEKFLEILDELNLNKKEKKIKWVTNYKELDKINFENIKGIILGDLNLINDNNIDTLLKLKLKGILVESLPSWFERRFHRIPTNVIGNKFQLLDRIKKIEDNYQIRIKRCGDIVVSLILIILTLPLLILISAVIYLEDRGPIFYQQKRTGINGSIIKILKFRSMKIDAEKEGIKWAQKSDPRITKIGSIIRALRIDELPQLLCVIKGDMSLIGPRPERPEIEIEKLKNIPYYSSRYIMKPGISGWAQVNYPYAASVKDTAKKLSYDIYYISHFSILLDLLILFKTIKIIINAKNSYPIKIK
tara:strand:- start:240 stop:1613 length:1374 start_codon:yes stop_codon:yes gene_type:complete